MEWLITNAIAAWLLPPGCLLVLAALGAWTARRRPRIGRGLVALALLALYALSTPFVEHALIGTLELPWRDPLADKSGQAIVVLGGGTYFSTPEYGGDTVSDGALARLRYAARLHRALDKPVLVAGGAPQGNSVSEGALMKQALETDFRIPVRWAEADSRNTLENARLSHRILSGAGIRSIYLVTHGWHMRRARLAFEHTGLKVIPAGTEYMTHFRLTPLDFIPDASALRGSSIFFHEAIGIGWYHLRFLLER